MSTKQVHKRKTLIGEIVKLSSTNTLKVRVENKYPHPKYGKIIMEHKSYLVHDSGKVSDLKLGDLVRIIECPPVSKSKTWEIEEKIK